MQIVLILLLIFALICALAVAITQNLTTAAIVFMGQSLVMSVVWCLLESPDLAITEAAVGAGIDSLLLFVTLKKIHAIDAGKLDAESRVREEGEAHGEDTHE